MHKISRISGRFTTARLFCAGCTKKALPIWESRTKPVHFFRHLISKLPTYPRPVPSSWCRRLFQVRSFLRVFCTALQNTLQNFCICIGPEYHQSARKGRRFGSDPAYGQFLWPAGYRPEGDIAWHQRPAARVCQIVLYGSPARNLHHRLAFQMTGSPPDRARR